MGEGGERVMCEGWAKWEEMMRYGVRADKRLICVS